MKQIRTYPHLRRGQRGFSIIELAVAMVIAVFLLAGLFSVLQGNMDTSSEQTAIAQLQDNERFAMQIFTNMIESAGFYPTANPAGVPNPPGYLDTALPADGTGSGSFEAGQALSGGTNGTGNDILYSRFTTNPNDGVSSCLGHTNPGFGPLFKNKLFVDTTQNALMCTDDNGVTSVALVGGVTNVTFLWGVNTAASLPNQGSCPATTYLVTADYLTLTPLQQTNVCTVQVTLTFTNPLYQLIPNGPVTPGQQGKPTIQFSKVIAVMAKAGP
jgi:type IV pilus assembly protein PilW